MGPSCERTKKITRHHWSRTWTVEKHVLPETNNIKCSRHRGHHQSSRFAKSKSMASRAFSSTRSNTSTQPQISCSQWQDGTSSRSSSKRWLRKKEHIFQVLRSEDPYTHAHVPETATQRREPESAIWTSTPLSVRVPVQRNTLPHTCCSANSRTARWHAFLSEFFLSPQHTSWLTFQVDSNFVKRKVMGHSRSTVPLEESLLRLPQCANGSNTPSSRSSQLRIQMTSHTLSLWTGVRRCSNPNPTPDLN